ncbi:glycoside hydrolase family 131 protein [Parathielavia appendiculata]|uniref:Glycoside hydrolase family 131 protein n=1 Tax=Parathielavia appendiculata TaxID=2587402 RepID=A0AAN6Z8I0_9PEZI|nr:glycoside hydrolase family 131 protein [Parathielavia appendiculata]
MHSATLLGLLAAAVTVSARACSGSGASEIKCPIVFDGRVKTTTQLTDFDSSSTSQFNPDYVKGNNLKWSDIVKFPNTANAHFDNATYKPFEVTISDQSIFQTQYGFRRAGLLFNGDTNEGSPGSTGVKTIHFSLKWDAQRALNLSHEYLLVWHEAADYSSNQFNFEAGAILGQAGLPKDTYKLLDRNNKQVWSTPILKKDWQNFAVTLDFNKNTLQVYYSKGNEPLKSVTSPVSNNNAGDGQYQIGLLKKPTGTDDVVNSGYQSNNLNEGLIYGSLFVEDSATGCVSK